MDPMGGPPPGMDDGFDGGGGFDDMGPPGGPGGGGFPGGLSVSLRVPTNSDSDLAQLIRDLRLFVMSKTWAAEVVAVALQANPSTSSTLSC